MEEERRFHVGLRNTVSFKQLLRHKNGLQAPWRQSVFIFHDKFCHLLPTGNNSLISSISFAQKPDFSGTWTLDLKKSKIEQMMRRMSRNITINITHKDPVIKIVQTINTQRGERTTETELKLDGKSIKKTTPGGMIATYRGYWSTDGKSIIIESERTAGRGNRTFKISSKQSFSLSKDGKILTCELSLIHI